MASSNSTMPSGMSANDMGLIMIIGYVPSLKAAEAFIGLYAIMTVATVAASHVLRVRGVGKGTCCCICSCCFCCCPSLRRMQIWTYTQVLPAAAMIELIG